MKKRMRYFRTLLLALVGVMLTACYSYDNEPVPSEPLNTVNINIYVPKPTAVTRADEGHTPATDAEQKLHKTYIWVYENVGGNDGLPVGFLSTDLSEVQPDNEGKYTVQVKLRPSTILNKRRVDVFVVGNVDAISSAAVNNVSLSSIENKFSITRAQLLNTFFGKVGTTDDFGVTTPVGPGNISEKGLPMSEYILDQNIYTNNGEISSTGVSLELKRAVSKIRFVFSRVTDFDGVYVSGITINGNVIPTSEYAFPAHTAPAGSTIERTPNLPANVTYEPTALTNTTTLPTNAIFEDDFPESFIFGAKGTETGDNYILRINQAMTTKLTDSEVLATAQNYGVTYLRESDKQITGKVFYRFPGDTSDREAPFEMAEENDFTRNHYYVVYGYFDHGKLNLTVTVMPWELKESTIVYSQTPMYNGTATWTANTYDQTMSYPSVEEEEGGIRTIALRGSTAAEYSFEIVSPQGFSWIATFTSLEGNPRAFKFVHADNSLSDTFTGTIGTGPTTLRIKAATDTPSESSAALLTLTVRQGEGKNIPLQELSIYKIVQIAN